MAPAGHALSGDIALADLNGQTLVMLGREVCARWHDDLMAMCERGGFTPGTVRYTGELGTQLTLVAAGLGVAVVQESTRMLRADGLTYVGCNADKPVISAVMWRSDDPSPVLARFLELLPA